MVVAQACDFGRWKINCVPALSSTSEILKMVGLSDQQPNDSWRFSKGYCLVVRNLEEC